MNGCAEVSLNLLAPGEAVDLLLGTAQIKDADAAASEAAAEIAVLCGNLPLYISICGGVIAGYENDPSWKTEVVGMLIEDRVGLIEDSTGDRTVERLVDSSLSTLKDAQTTLVFMALGVCPEDVLVELPVALLICGADVDVVAAGKLSSMSMRRIVKTLLDRHLLQGSAANGVQMHDIVRDLVRSRLGGEDGIRVKQRVVVAAMLSASPAEGWTPDDTVGLYAEQALETHMVEALLTNPLDDVDAQTWLLHSSTLIVASAATVFGSAALEALSAAKEGAGDLVGAARAAWAARNVRGIPAKMVNDLSYRTSDLLESADDASAIDFEKAVLQLLWSIDVTTERHTKACKRATALLAGGVATFESKWKEFNDMWFAGLMAWSPWAHPGGAPLDQSRSSFKIMLKSNLCLVEAIEVTDNRILSNQALFYMHLTLGWTLGNSELESWDLHTGGGEAALVAALEHHSFAECFSVAKASAVGMDCLLHGVHIWPLTLAFGNLPAADLWAAKAIASFKEIDFASTPAKFTTIVWEPVWARTAVTVLLRLNRKAEAFAVLDAIGFCWSDRGFAMYEAFLPAAQQLPGLSADEDPVYHRLVVYLASPQTAALDKAVGEWIPVPAALFELDRTSCVGYWCGGGMSVLPLAARAFLQLGRDDDAFEVARLAMSTAEPAAGRNYFAVECHCVLGQVAAKRGDLEEAGGHFGRALAVAKASPRLPMLELLAAQEWKRAVSGSGGAADAVIDAACAKMGKSRAELASLLL